jgi:ABC-2 type transport system permease protein
MLRSIFAKTFWDQRRALLAWSIGVAFATALYASFYPTMQNPQMEAAMEAYPQALMDAFGFQDLVSPAGYLGGTVFGIIGPILIIIFTVANGTRAVAGDEEGGTLDLLLAYPVSRTRVVAERFGALAVATMVLGMAILVVLLVLRGPAELNISAGNLAGMVLHLVLLGLCFGSLALGLGAATGRRGLALSVAAILGVLAWFANTLAPSSESIAWLQNLSPFHYYSGGQPLRNGPQADDILILLGVSLLAVAAGAVIFNRRDVAV